MDYLIEFDYNADEVDELSIRKGDIVNKVRTYEDGWMFGVLRGKEGVFPSNFGKPLTDEKKKIPDEDVSEITEDSKNVSIDEDSNDHGRPAKKVTGVGYGNIFQGGKIQLKQTTNNRDTITKVKRNTNIDEVKPEPAVENKPNHKSRVEMARVIHSYKAENFDELNLEEGEIITVVDKENEDDGWWKGKLSNGTIGVFPDNFVELIKTPLEEKPLSRLQQNTAPPKVPPPVTAAKPKPIPPRPPVLQTVPEPKSASSKTQSRIGSQEKEDGISFDTVQPHKLLVGPNADRVKHRGKKLPSSVNIVLADNTGDKPFVDEDRKNTPQAQKPASKEPGPAHPEKLPDLSAQKSKQWSGSNSSSELLSELVTVKSKSARDSGPAGVSTTTTQVDKSPDVLSSKLKPTRDSFFERSSSEATTSEPKMRFHGPSKKFENADNSGKDDAINSLQKRVSHLQDENQELRRELAELRKSSGEQITWLKTKLNKLIDEFDEEKVKRAGNEVNFNRLKTSVEALEGTLLSRAHE